MIAVNQNVSLKPYNTFGIDVLAKYFCEVTSSDQFQELVQADVFKNEKRIFLGKGSNVLFTKDFDGLVIHNQIQGMEVVSETDEKISLRIGSGEIWHHVVLHCVQHHWGGIENLSLIPGTVGAAPIQNIGAYGVEVSSVIEKVEVIDILSGGMIELDKGKCGFAYRESVFKNEFKEKFFISSVTLTLSKKNHQLNITYGAITNTLKHMNVTQPTIQSVSDAVIKIREEKLPDYVAFGNAGSFFKNPEITEQRYQQLKNEFAVVPHYPTANQQVKVPAGWLIEQCGWKGKKNGRVGTHAMQALVLVNFGGASGEEIFQFAMKIIESVKEKFSITLTPEVNIF